MFNDVGIGSVTSMDEFYKNRVLKYHENMTRVCKMLQEDYKKLRNPDNKVQFEDLKTIRYRTDFILKVSRQ